MQDSLRELVERRCRRAIAVVLGTKEREVDRYLPPDAQAKLRKVVLDQFNDFSSMVLDILESSAQDSVFNDLWLTKIEEIHSAVVD